MARRPKTDRVPRTRAGGTWTEAAFWGFLRSGIRQLSRRWPPISDCLRSSRRPYTGENKRRKWEYQCSQCEHWYVADDVQVDHIQQCGRLLSFDDLGRFAESLFCEQDGLRVKCKSCHDAKTAEERVIREGSIRVDTTPRTKETEQQSGRCDDDTAESR